MATKLQVTGYNEQVETFHFSSEDTEYAKGLIRERSTVPLIKSAFTVVRTHQLSVLAQDLFLPTFIQHAWKVNHIALKIIAVLFALTFDAITLPIRLIKCIPRVLSNKQQKEHSLKHYLKMRINNPEFYKDHHVKIRLEWTSESRESYTEHQNGLIRQRTYHQQTNYVKRQVNFIDLHPYPVSDQIHSGTC